MASHGMAHACTGGKEGLSGGKGGRGSLLHLMIWGSHIQPEVVLNIVRNLPCHLEELE